MAGKQYWGVDSAAAVTWPPRYDKGKPVRLFAHVKERAKRVPDFWGRYIGGRYSMTKEEVRYIFEQSEGKTRVLVIYNGAWDGYSSVQGGFREGSNDAQRAVCAATDLDVPPGVRIWCDIEGGWSPKAAWFEGWWAILRQSSYESGFYCRANAWQFWGPYLEAVKKDYGDSITNLRATILRPLIKAQKDQPVYYVPPTVQNELLLWTTQPQDWSLGPRQDPDATPFKAESPPPLPGAVAMWQYQIDAMRRDGPGTGVVDLDLCDARAYETMWAGV
jgi:hypothetical protein